MLDKVKIIGWLVAALWLLGLLTWGAFMMSGHLATMRGQAKTKAKIELLKIRNEEIVKTRKMTPKEFEKYLNKLAGVE